MGFYRVVRNGIHLFSVTNGMNLSGKVTIAVEVGSDLGALQTVTLSANGQDIPETQSLYSPFTSPHLYFEVDTASLNNGGQTLQARATFLVPQTNTFDSPYVSVSSIPATVNVFNDILYPNWVTEFSEDLLIVTVSTVHLNSTWEVDVYGSAQDYIGTFSGTTTGGLIDFAWNLLDPQGVKRNDETFYTVTTVTLRPGRRPLRLPHRLPHRIRLRENRWIIIPMKECGMSHDWT